VLGTTKGPAGDQLVVTIDWNRMWENGATTTQGPLGSVKLTMSGGDTVVLDRIAHGVNGELRQWRFAARDVGGGAIGGPAS
jgi:hypothetical protein